MTEQLDRGSVVRCGTIIDRLTTRAGSVVLVKGGTGHRVVRLSEVGAAVLDLVSDSQAPLSLDDVTSVLVDLFGLPEKGTARSAAARVVDELAAEQVVLRTLA